MSGILSGITEIADIATILFGGSPVTVGSVALAGWEIPEKITWGGKQRLNVHKLPGGARIIDAMGRDDMPIGWSGILQGGDAPFRARQLDALRISGGQIPLIWGDFSRIVVVASFECDYEKPYWMHYRISCEVLGTGLGPSIDGAPSLLESLNSDISDATGIDISATYSAVTNGLAQVQAVAGPLTALAGGSPAVASLLGKVSGVANSIDLGLSTAGNIVNSMPVAADTINSLASSAGDLAGLSAIKGYIARTAANLTAA